jgi:hypothetical protein
VVLSRRAVRMRRNVVLKKEVKAFVWGCESLLAAVESGSEYSLEELHLIDLYAEVIQQTSAAGLFTDVTLHLTFIARVWSP